MVETAGNAHFDNAMTGVVIDHVVVTDRDVVREAQRWTTGERGAIVDDSTVLVGSNLASFVTEAVKIGSHALSAAGQARETKALEQMVKDVGDQTAQSTTEAVQIAERAARDAALAVTKAAEGAQKTLTAAEARTRKEFADAVKTAKSDLGSEIKRVFAGENPELVERLQPLLEQFGMKLDARVAASTSELIAKATRQFDPSDPTSPMAKHQASLAAQQNELTKQLAANHREIASKVEELVTALKVEDARSAIASVTPIKGDSYADQLHALMQHIAGGLGDEYVDTSAATGSVPRSKKGDGVLIAGGGAARVVLEMTDSSRAEWTAYLDEAERNRDAVSSLGLVRTTDQNNGQSIRVLGPRRIIMAFDPETDDVNLLQTVVLLLRTAGITASSRSRAHEIATAEEKINAAVDALSTIDDIKKVAVGIGKNAEKIDQRASGVAATISRLLTEALTALAGTVPESIGSEARGDADKSAA